MFLWIVSQRLDPEIRSHRQCPHQSGILVINRLWIIENREIKRRETNCSLTKAEHDWTGLKCWRQRLDNLRTSKFDSRSNTSHVCEISIPQTGQVVQFRFT